MKKLLLLLAAVLFSALAYSQHTFKVTVKDAKTNQPLSGASVLLFNSTKGAIADSLGTAILNGIPTGKQIIVFTYIGYQKKTDTLKFPLSQAEPMVILLQSTEENEALEEVVVSATRGSRTIDNIPTRVEVIAGEELDEKGNMKPGDIRMMLAESTGIQTQQTSATSGSSSIRIQGLDGKYTQIIRDGFPLYSGFSGGLGLLQVAPLDLQQVEVIKGSSSTLYGGGAIAGLVNLVSKKPTEERQLNFLLNGTSALGLDASGFYAQKFEKVGITTYAAYNHGSAYDPSKIGLTAIPKFNRFTLNPKLFIYFDEATTLMAGVNATVEKRIGGNIDFVKGKTVSNPYFEENNTDRYSTQVELGHRLSENGKLTFKNSISYYDRSIELPSYLFSGRQVSTYSEVNYSRNGEKADWVFGANFLSDNFKEDIGTSAALRNYSHNTIGAFVQNTWNSTEKLTIETGIRGDYHNEYGFFFLPRISGLWKINDHVSTRLGGGFGYKAPNVFTEDAERIQFRYVLPINVSNTKAERSYGANYDINYRTSLFTDKVGFSINHMFFYTRIADPILLTPIGSNLAYVQPNGNIITKGMETNIKLTYADFKLFVGYTLADVGQKAGSVYTNYPLVSKHRLNNVLMYEIEDKWKIGAEAYYFSKQQLNDGVIGKSYWTAGLMAEKLWEKFSIFVNFENFTDTRQTKFDSIYTGNIASPIFRDIYAPVDGFVINGGIKLKL
ncbi:TonB-dependent receptor [Pedobacter insulae]|uniref:Iron complex outermembrane recepter protein n=1 Tax=Pedobacter insulae TaxID=414048 RepID=A0A1I2WUP9_9SPHI|nr:TonB-dependent receptor [Pedobacter insulae]SFH04309.1 iron complex outermembrane recepter protein [Pedobacter insulae]